MRFWIELRGVPIGITELPDSLRAVGTFQPLPAYDASRGTFREGANALWDLLTRPRQSPRGRRWRAGLIRRMQQRAEALSLRTPSGISVTTARVFLFDSTRLAGPPIVIVHFDEGLAGVAEEVTPPRRERRAEGGAL